MSAYDQARAILYRTDPDAALSPQEASDWTGAYPLPAAVAAYYAELGPDDLSIAGYGNGYFLPSLANLWAQQTGYRTHGHTGARLPGWDEDWLVVGDEGGDPFIFSRERGVVLRARHGGGSWQPEELFRDLAGMVTVLAVLGEIVTTAGASLTDEDGLIQARSLEAAQRRLTPVSGSPDRAAARGMGPPPSSRRWAGRRRGRRPLSKKQANAPAASSPTTSNDSRALPPGSARRRAYRRWCRNPPTCRLRRSCLRCVRSRRRLHPLG